MITIDHGIEYRVMFDKSFDIYPVLSKYISLFKKQVSWNDNDGIIIIANTKNTDKRLLASDYYKQNEERWFKTVSPTRINDIFSLTESEQEYLDFILKEFGEAITDHGWYEVQYHY